MRCVFLITDLERQLFNFSPQSFAKWCDCWRRCHKDWIVSVVSVMIKTHVCINKQASFVTHWSRRNNTNRMLVLKALKSRSSLWMPVQSFFYFILSITSSSPPLPPPKMILSTVVVPLLTLSENSYWRLTQVKQKYCRLAQLQMCVPLCRKSSFAVKARSHQRECRATIAGQSFTKLYSMQSQAADLLRHRKQMFFFSLLTHTEMN